jgi:hypothetical protein
VCVVLPFSAFVLYWYSLLITIFFPPLVIWYICAGFRLVWEYIENLCRFHWCYGRIISLCVWNLSFVIFFFWRSVYVFFFEKGGNYMPQGFSKARSVYMYIYTRTIGPWYSSYVCVALYLDYVSMKIM